MKQPHHMSATSKLAHLVRYLAESGGLITAVQAAKVMDCQSKQVSSLCAVGVRKGFLVMTLERAGVSYRLADGIAVERTGPNGLCVCSTRGVEADEDLAWLRIKRSWVQYEGQPLPFELRAGAVRSVFDLGGAAHG